VSDETYNGWKNYPTWSVNLWLSNDEGLYNSTRKIVGDILDEETSRSKYWTLEESHRFAAADALKGFVEELGVEIDNGMGGTESGHVVGFASDLLGYALDHVDWEEIADAWIEDCAAV